MSCPLQLNNRDELAINVDRRLSEFAEFQVAPIAWISMDFVFLMPIISLNRASGMVQVLNLSEKPGLSQPQPSKASVLSSVASAELYD